MEHHGNTEPRSQRKEECFQGGGIPALASIEDRPIPSTIGTAPAITHKDRGQRGNLAMCIYFCNGPGLVPDDGGDKILPHPWLLQTRAVPGGRRPRPGPRPFHSRRRANPKRRGSIRWRRTSSGRELHPRPGNKKPNPIRSPVTQAGLLDVGGAQGRRAKEVADHVGPSAPVAEAYRSAGQENQQQQAQSRILDPARPDAGKPDQKGSQSKPEKVYGTDARRGRTGRGGSTRSRRIRADTLAAQNRSLAWSYRAKS